MLARYEEDPAVTGEADLGAAARYFDPVPTVCGSTRKTELPVSPFLGKATASCFSFFFFVAFFVQVFWTVSFAECVKVSRDAFLPDERVLVVDVLGGAAELAHHALDALVGRDHVGVDVGDAGTEPLHGVGFALVIS